MKKGILIILSLLILSSLTGCSRMSSDLSKAEDLINSGSYTEALALLDEYKDNAKADELIKRANAAMAVREAYEKYLVTEYEEAIAILEDYTYDDEAFRLTKKCEFEITLSDVLNHMLPAGDFVGAMEELKKYSVDVPESDEWLKGIQQGYYLLGYWTTDNEELKGTILNATYGTGFINGIVTTACENYYGIKEGDEIWSADFGEKSSLTFFGRVLSVSDYTNFPAFEDPHYDGSTITIGDIVWRKAEEAEVEAAERSPRELMYTYNNVYIDRTSHTGLSLLGRMASDVWSDGIDLEYFHDYDMIFGGRVNEGSFLTDTVYAGMTYAQLKSEGSLLRIASPIEDNVITTDIYYDGYDVELKIELDSNGEYVKDILFECPELGQAAKDEALNVLEAQSNEEKQRRITERDTYYTLDDTIYVDGTYVSSGYITGADECEGDVPYVVLNMANQYICVEYSTRLVRYDDQYGNTFFRGYVVYSGRDDYAAIVDSPRNGDDYMRFSIYRAVIYGGI